MYESPITVSTLVDKIVQTTNEIIDEEIYKAVIRTGVTINKVDLEKALKQDYDRYEGAYKKGFEDGKEEATKEMIEKIKTVLMEGSGNNELPSH